MGDAIEAQALEAVLAGRPDRCRLGSVKSNLGNLGPASGLAGLIKVVLALEQRQLPASLHFRRPNPQLSFDRLPLEVQTSLSPWPSGVGPLVAGVSAFGVGGTNAHLVLEEAPARSRVTRLSQEKTPDGAPHLLVLSAATPEALIDRVRVFRDWLGGDPSVLPPLEDVCYTAAARRAALRHRVAVVGRSHAEVARLLEETLPGLRRGGCHGASRRPRLAFVFPHSQQPPETAALWRSWGVVPDFVVADGVWTVDGPDVLFLTLSPCPSLQDAAGANLCCPGPREGGELTPLLAALGGLFVRGWPVAWDGLHSAGRVVPLPGYPWQRQRLCLKPLSERDKT
jgi:acyl transferase domain-containing protein